MFNYETPQEMTTITINTYDPAGRFDFDEETERFVTECFQ